MATLKAKTIADFLSENDKGTVVRNRIRAQLAAMLKIGPEHHEDERAFCVAAGVATALIPAYREDFKQYIAYVPKLMGRKDRFVWFADPKKVPPKYRYNGGDAL